MKKFKYLLLVGLLFPVLAFSKVIVAIDAGHGGHDPGAIGPTKLYEKSVTLGIAKKIEALAQKDRDIDIVLTRNRDVFLSVFQRSEVARKYKANYLISIHADATNHRSASGASVWVLSMKRADTELGRWLEDHEKQSELLGGAGDALSSNQNQYLSQTILDLQFSNSQKVGYELGHTILKSLAPKVKLHKKRPEHASLGVLRSPDIPSVLVEVGFISNRNEEALLRTDAYQQKIAQAIFDGIKNYVKTHPQARVR